MFQRLLKSAAMAVLSGAMIGISPVMAQAEAAKPAHFVVKDARKIGEGSVRVAAIQGTENSPNILIMGGNKEVFEKVKRAAEQSEAAGYSVRAIFIGPTGATPALEIYAKGHHVTNPIDPYMFTQAELVKLIRDIHKQFYQR